MMDELLDKVHDEELREELRSEVALIRTATLEDLSVEALVDELMRRHDAGVVALYRDLSDKKYDVHTPVWGAPPTILGLIDIARMRACNILMQGESGDRE